MDQDADSAALLREFAEHRSETAFARLVHRHLNLVYSAALRRCGGRSGLAQDVCQTVFIDLARKARALPANVVVAGWLYQHACFVAATLLRAENRRQQREEIAMQHLALADDTDWSRLAPLLDDALLELATPDRDSLVLRYLEQRPLAEVGVRLGLSENAARMRVDRALDKLRAKLAKRGVTSTVGALATAMTGPAVTAAPATLAATITSTALAAVVTTTSTFGLLTFMASTKLKAAAVTAVLAAAGTALVLQHRTGERLRTDNADLEQRVVQLTKEVQADRQAATPIMPEPERPRETQAELLRLRGEVARLRSQATEPKAAPATGGKDILPKMADRPGEPLAVGGDFVSLDQWGNAGSATPEASAMTVLWAWRSRNLSLLKEITEPMTEETRRWFAENDPRALNEDMMMERAAFMVDTVKAARAKKLDTSSPSGRVQIEIEALQPDVGNRTMYFKIPLKFNGERWRTPAREIPTAKP